MFSINNNFTLSWEVPYIYADNYVDDNTLSFHFHNYNELISTLHSVDMSFFNKMKAKPDKFQTLAVGLETQQNHQQVSNSIF